MTFQGSWELREFIFNISKNEIKIANFIFFQTENGQTDETAMTTVH